MVDSPSRGDIESYARQRAQQHGLDPELIVRQIQQESGFNPRAVSSAGARGVMQLMPRTARSLGVNPDDWRQNVDGGVRYMAQQFRDFGGDTELALAAYNAGPGNARARGKDWSRYAPETRNYVRVLAGRAQPQAEDDAQGGGGDTFASMGRTFSTVSSQQLAPTDTPEMLRAAGYEYDTDRNSWFRVVSKTAPPAPLEDAYLLRQEDRANAAIDIEEQQYAMQVAFQSPIDIAGSAALGVARDVGAGIFAEGGQAVVSGIKRGVNETLNATDAVADWIETYVPATLQWEGIDGDASTPFRIRLTTQNKAEERLTELRGGQKPTLLQRLGMAQTRLPTNEDERPTTVTGKIIEGVSQFGTGFAGGGRVLRSWQTATRGGRIGKALVQGALADFAAFDGNQERLTNLLAEHAPEALGPALSLLAAGDDDPELIGRFKNAVEGSVLGGATDLLTGGVNALRQARRVRAEARQAAEAEGLQVDPTISAADATARGEQLQAAVREALGDPDAPLFTVNPAAERSAPDFQAKIDRAERVTRTAPADLSDTAAEAKPGANLFNLNMGRIESPEDVQAVITGMADQFAKDAGLARRAGRSWEETREASANVDWVASMARRRPGEAVNAETALAYREAVNASATKVLELARAVRDEPSLAAQYAFRRATAAHYAIQNELLGARAEAGRALNAFKIPAGTPGNALRQVDDLLADAGGATAAQDLAKRVLDAAEKGDVALNQMIRGGALARTRDIIRLIYTNSLLSGPGTAIINAVGSPVAMGLNLASRAVSPRLARAFGGDPATQVGEAMSIVHGYGAAIRDMFRLNPIETAERISAEGGAALRREGVFRGLAPGVQDAAARAGVALRSGREEAGTMVGSNGRPLAAAAWRVGEDTVLGRFLDVVQMVIESPSNITGLTDDFFKVMAARGELHAQAFRQVVREGMEGEPARARLAQLLEEPTDDMLSAAERQMHELTFTRSDGKFDEKLSQLRRMIDDNSGPLPIASYILPFLRTPANLTSLAVRSSPLAPFSARFRNALREGGAAAETAKAQMALGTGLWSVWMGMALDGQITGAGPANPEQRAAMMRSDEFGQPLWQPYSVKLGGRWWSYERLDPLGSQLSLIGDFGELLVNDDWDGANREGMGEIVANAIMAMGQAFFDKSMLRGAMEFTTAVTSGNQGMAERFVMSKASSSIPASSFLRTLRRGQDPYMRETHDVISAMRNTVPLLSEGLPPSRDLWGKPRTYQTGLGSSYDAVMPIQTKRQGGSAIDLEMLENGVSVAMPTRSISVMGERVTLKNRPDIYSELVKRAGEPAFEHLNAVAEGVHQDSDFYYSLDGGPDGGRAAYIEQVVSAYRAEAMAEVLDIYGADLNRMAADAIDRRDEARMAQ